MAQNRALSHHAFLCTDIVQGGECMAHSIAIMIASDSVLSRILRFFQFNRVSRILKGTGPAITDQDRRGDPTKEQLISSRELEAKFKLAWTRLAHMEVDAGDYLEFGPRHGQVLPGMQRVVSKLGLNVRLLGFEVTEHASGNSGIPPTDDSNSVEPSLKHFHNNQDFNQYYEQKISDGSHVNSEAFKKLELKRASVIMINCTSYAGAKLALSFAAPLIIDHTMIFINNVSKQTDVDAASAYAEFLEENDHLKSLSFRSYKPDGQIFFVTSTRVG
ncbi:hypothetical protein WBG78_10675 [Chryseolinea sp. T2]|uniref:hypothetical protein n=1 Tax=Chryseolinea sp. T2 TaxID=3129255 RepID=UPI0030780C25